MSNARSTGELGFQRHIIDVLCTDPRWRERKATSHYDKDHAVDREMLEGFLKDTQPKALAALQRTYGIRAIDVLISEYEKACRAKGSSNVDVLRSGVDINSIHVDLLYGRPASSLNPKLTAKYEANRLSVMEEVWIDDASRIDLVLFVNGLAWAAFELKYQPDGSTWRDAVYQWTYERDHKNRLLERRVGTIVNFAMDNEECHMATSMDGERTRFLPFNRGRGEGINQGKGNPVDDGSGDYPTHYVWDDVLAFDSVMELLTKFVFVSRKEEYDQAKDKRVLKETVIFPRYHQRDALHKLLKSVSTSGSELNYLIQHSAGSGKTYTISWLAHRLSSLHGADGAQVFDTVIVATDRKVVDRQLQAAIKSLERTTGVVKVMGEDCTSADLSDALFEGKAKVVVTTLQKFLYVDELAGKICDRRFAVIIDEAHNSTAGRNLMAIQNAVGGEQAGKDEDVTDTYERLVRSHGKRANMSVFAFTATPKARTLKLFGAVDPANPDLQKAFHTYSMKQAIEEGFILDVLTNYLEYRTYYRVSKAVEDDPLLHTAKAKREIARIAELDDTNINQRIGIIVEHFRNHVLGQCGLGRREKAMVVTTGREEAVRYRAALQAYIERHHYHDVHALVAFSGKVTTDVEYDGFGGSRTAKGWEYTERGMNGFSDTRTADRFDTDERNVLLVADKFQVGFDQPKLCAMYVMKRLRDVEAVQTLSRLNRTLPGKRTIVLDFVNTCADMEKAFSHYYTTTILSNTVTVSQLIEMGSKLDGYDVIDDDDVERYAAIVLGATTKKLSQRDAAKADILVRRAKKRLENMYQGNVALQGEFRMTCSGFVRLYEFLSLASSFGDAEMEKKYGYVRDLLEILDTGGHGGVSVKDKINFERFTQKEVGDTGTKHRAHPSDPMVRLAGVSTRLTTDEKDRLSEIIAIVNARVGGGLDKDVAIIGGLQIKELLLKVDALKASAKANNEADFSIAYYDSGEDVLYDGLQQNNKFFGEVLKDEELMRRMLGLYVHDVYETLRGEER
ncbi:MAG: DEAD/DEAH box helicase family protein [Coriobacteriales bacterium]|nr:DEAD/DEAH box helicase family protein [Coriobacteriales bacterium]